ncbi:hypothetical protein CKM354_001047300 [Cercospora kikuchii]|uniref:Uncharacterized protein n=1 Tax=Cercospora kikuchii TaxID=84275 RepID=A0A9P3CWZ8_9PEZI|nr:uncharacterized protein CKM354_001047300 [Cercospora kikuchii]GIZ47380.1 hypothetical protein CKM354_001047300 [Cercospora kikuchii]
MATATTQVMMHRKPLPTRRHPDAAAPSFTHQTPKPPHAQQPYNNSHSRARTNSSGVMPMQQLPSQSPPMATAAASYSMAQQQQQQQQGPYPGQQRRTLSNATSSTSSSNTNLNRAPTNTNYSTNNSVRRSTSSRSNGSASPTSYVALMRKQKATVWCDRAQHEDPRILVAQRQARMRAAAEVAGGQSYAASSRTSTSSAGITGGVRSKIRHHGAPKASAYKTAVGGAGVPMRLSASEVDDGNNSDEDTGGRYHVRKGSGRSNGSGSGRRGHSYLSPNYSNGNTPPGVSPVDSIGEEETPMPRERENSLQKDDYFLQTPGGEDSEEKFGNVGTLPSRKMTAEEQIRQQQKNAEDLRRRGSVDERTMTMSGPRLFVANPDLSD